MTINLRCCLLSGVSATVCITISLTVWVMRVDHSQDLEILPRNETLDELLLVMIHSRGDYEGMERRRAIRETWLSNIDEIALGVGKAVNYKFVLGGKDILDEARRNLTREQKEYGDLILFNDVTDSHDSLTLRTLRGFQYLTSSQLNHSYMLKCDDDTFINLKPIISELSEREHPNRLYWGEFLGNSEVITDGIYAELGWSICESYLPYPYGGGYVLSKDLIELMSANADYLKLFTNEDVAIGAWLAPYTTEYRFDARFNTGSASRGCKRQFIVVHKVPAVQMYDYFRAVKKDGYPCNRSNRWFGWYGYIYNWNVLPSKCCKRKRRIP